MQNPTSLRLLRRWCRNLGFLGFLAFLVGCVNQCEVPFPPSSFIDKLRILAIQAEPPEVTPGKPVKLRFLAVDSKGIVRVDGFPPFPTCFSDAGPVDPSAFWVGCLPGVGPVEDSSRSCTNFSFLSPGGADGGTQDAGPGDGGIDLTKFQITSPPCGSSVNWQTPASYLDPLSAEEQVTGREAVMVLSAKIQGQDQVTFKRVRLSKREESKQNTNPRFLGVSIGGTEASCCDERNPDACKAHVIPANKSVEIRARIDPQSQDLWPITIPNQPREDISIVWFTNAGEFNRQSTLLSGKTNPQDSPWPSWFPTDYQGAALSEGTEATIVAIAQDFRGGISWITCRLRLGPPTKEEATPEQ
ncbi:MAG: hypothetical protein H6727_09095 [Myxococcales bacterium]|nr:hypothetical protein [Myxococcales bacterium]